MTRRVSLFLDDRGLHRSLTDQWTHAVDADVVWFVGAIDHGPDDDQARDVTPILPFSADELAALAREPSEEEVSVIALFATVDDLRDAAIVGLPPADVTILNLREGADTTRLSAEVHLTDAQREGLAFLEARGFTFELQPLPNVTARPWSPAATPHPVPHET